MVFSREGQSSLAKCWLGHGKESEKNRAYFRAARLWGVYLAKGDGDACIHVALEHRGSLQHPDFNQGGSLSFGSQPK
jgi:hypothetical protein